MKHSYRLDLYPHGFITIYRDGDLVREMEFENSSDRSWHLGFALECFYDLVEEDGLLEECPPV